MKPHKIYNYPTFPKYMTLVAPLCILLSMLPQQGSLFRDPLANVTEYRKLVRHGETNQVLCSLSCCCWREGQ